jgi:hypothetical protein
MLFTRYEHALQPAFLAYRAFRVRQEDIHGVDVVPAFWSAVTGAKQKHQVNPEEEWGNKGETDRKRGSARPLAPTTGDPAKP